MAESGKELREKLARDMKAWQRIEDASVTSTSQVIQNTNNAVIRTVMEIIQADSRMHHAVQGFIADTLEKQAVEVNVDDLAEIWGRIEEHIELERKMVSHVREALENVKGRHLVVQEYFLNYLLADEKKHDMLLDTLSTIKKGMYPYG